MRSEMAEWMAVIRSGGTSDLRDFPPKLPSMLESGRSQTPERRMTVARPLFFQKLAEIRDIAAARTAQIVQPAGSG